MVIGNMVMVYTSCFTSRSKYKIQISNILYDLNYYQKENVNDLFI